MPGFKYVLDRAEDLFNAQHGSEDESPVKPPSKRDMKRDVNSHSQKAM